MAWEDNNRDETDTGVPPRLVSLSEYGIGTQSGVRTLTFWMGHSSSFGEHVERLHQLSWSPDGTLAAHTPDGRWILPPTQAIWLPAGVPHDVAVLGPASVHCFYFRPDGCRITWDRPTVVGVDPLLGGLLGLLVARSMGQPQGRRVRNVVVDLLTPVEAQPLVLPMPATGPARTAAVAILRDPSDGRSSAEWGRVVGANAKTLQRAFVRETGLTFGQWRTQARLRVALALLADATSIGEVARRVGYREASGFTKAFRRHFGTSPHAYRAARTGPGPWWAQRGQRPAGAASSISVLPR
ncbi:MAG: helix-turn-helix transcriptional regulator [Ilumatobacteraceae bacterium]